MKRRNFKSTFLLVVFAVTLSSCSKSEKDEPEVSPQAEYVLREIRYSMSDTDKIDTLTVQLLDTTLYNTGSNLAILKFADHFAGLKKTSQFQVSNPEVLPADLKLDQFEVNVPSQWIQRDDFSYFSKKLPFSSVTVEVPYGSFLADSISVSVPAKSKIIVNRSVQAHQISNSFTAIVENKTNSQAYTVNGKWKGLLRYDHLNTSLSEQPL